MQAVLAAFIAVKWEEGREFARVWAGRGENWPKVLNARGSAGRGAHAPEQPEEGVDLHPPLFGLLRHRAARLCSRPPPCATNRIASGVAGGVFTHMWGQEASVMEGGNGRATKTEGSRREGGRRGPSASREARRARGADKTQQGEGRPGGRAGRRDEGRGWVGYVVPASRPAAGEAGA